MKKILFITPYTPSKIAAAENYTRLLLRHFPEDYEVDLAYFSTIENAYFQPETPNIHPIFLGLVTRKERIRMCLSPPFVFPLFSVRFRRDVLKRFRILHREKRYDLIICDHSQTFLYGLYFPDVPKILISHDIEFQRFGRKYGKLADWLCARTEKKLLSQKNATIGTFSEKDCALIRDRFGLDVFQIDNYMDDAVVRAEPGDDPGTDFVFFANWARPDNSEGLLWFIEHVLPLLSGKAVFAVIGGGAPPILKEAMEKAGIRYTGFVDDPYPEIAQSRAVLAPLFQGAGIKVKVLESLACGTPVIGTDIAFEGIPQVFQKAMFPCSSAEDFAKTILSFSFDPPQKKALKKLYFEQLKGRTPLRVIREILH